MTESEQPKHIVSTTYVKGIGGARTAVYLWSDGTQSSKYLGEDEPDE